MVHLRRRVVHVSMTSLTSSLGHRVVLVFHDAISFSGPSFASSWHQPSRRKLSCNCTLPTSSRSATPSILPSTHDSLHSAPETEITKAVDLLQRDPPRTSIVHGHQLNASQSVMSLIVALAMTIGIQGAPSSRDTFEDVPQTLSGESIVFSHSAFERNLEDIKSLELFSDSIDYLQECHPVLVLVVISCIMEIAFKCRPSFTYQASPSPFFEVNCLAVSSSV